MIFRQFVLPGVILPALAAAFTLQIFVIAGKGRARPAGAGLATAIAFVAAYVAMTGWPRLLPVEATQRLFFLTAGAGILSLVGVFRARGNVPWWVQASAVALLLGWLLQTPLQHQWNGGQAAGWLAALFTVGLALCWAFGQGLAAHEPTDSEDGGDPDLGGERMRALLLMALLGGAAIILGLSRSARLAQLMGAVAVGVGVSYVVAQVRGRRAWLAGDGLAVAIPVLGLLVCGYFYAELRPLTGALVVLSLLMFALMGTKRPLWLRLAALFPLSIALALAVGAELAAPSDPYGYEYGLFEIDARNKIVSQV